MKMHAKTRTRRRERGLLDDELRCSKCDGPNERAPQRYCGRCHAGYQRGWRSGRENVPCESLRFTRAKPNRLHGVSINNEGDAV